MQLSISSKPLDQITSDVLVVLLFEDKISPQEKLVDGHLNGQIRKLRSSKDFLGEVDKVRLLFHSQKPPRILLIGLGKQQKLTLEKIREAISLAIGELKKLPVQSLSLLLPKIPSLSIQVMAEAVSEALILSSYEFVYYKIPEKEKPKLEQGELLLLSAKDKKAASAGCASGQILGESVNFARDLGNHPSNIATPDHLADHALELAKQYKNIKVKILNRPEIAKENLNLLLAVSQGSDQEPKFIILEYRAKKSAPQVVLVGKGITFDSGGISIKPWEKMEEMKFDMAGAATVMAIIKAAAELKLPLNLTGLIPATENLPSGKALKPGDIIRSRLGKSIEIISTDAEGRVLLADALDYAKKYQPALVIDFATLTGAIVVALGDELTGVFTNREGLLNKLKMAARITGEKIWPMPLEETYEELIKSEVADLRNIGTIPKIGDAINAANFLKHFVDYPWIHLDIAGVAFATREKPYRGKGATGTGIRLAIEFLKHATTILPRAKGPLRSRESEAREMRRGGKLPSLPLQ